MPIAELDGHKIVLITEYRERELVKQVPGVRWETQEQVWWLPLSWAACMQLRGVFGDELRVGVNLNAWAKQERETRVQPCMALRTAADAVAVAECTDCEGSGVTYTDPPQACSRCTGTGMMESESPLAFFTELRPFQRAGVQFLATAKHALLADEMGLGKTVQAIAALEAIGPEAYPVLIVSPNSMKRTWADEFAKWAPARLVEVAGRTAATRRKAIAAVRDSASDVLIINYEALRHETRLAPYGSVTLDEKDRQEKALNEVQWRSVVADEAHRVKDPRSKQARALWWVSKDAPQRFALTGTPVANSPEDMWSLMRFVSPAEFPAKTRFIERYALTGYNVYGFQEIMGVKGETREELFRILDPRMIRRTKAAVMPEMPEQIRTTRYVEMDAKQKKAYEEIRKEMMTQLDGGVLLAGDPLTQFLRMSQFASATGAMEDGKLILTSPSCKVDALMEIEAELGEDRAVVFAESRQLIELCAKQLLKAKIPFGQFTGKVPEQERQLALQNFNAGRTRLLLVTLGAGGEGLSLPGCTTAIFLQRSWSMIKNAQAEARISGIGRGSETVPATYIDVVTANTIEHKIAAGIADKERLMQEVVRDADTVKSWLAK